MSPRPARLLLSGYYGFGNFGDEAILRTFVEQWRGRRPADEITVLSARPEQTSATYAVQALPRWKWQTLRDAVAATDVLVSGGGGLLQDATSLRSLLYYCELIRRAKKGGKKAVIFAQGIGPLGFIGREIVRRFCAGVDLASVRDEASAALLRRILQQADVRLAADPAFVMPPPSKPNFEGALAREGIPESADSPLVAVVVRPDRLLPRVLEVLAAAVDRFTMRHGAQVVFLALHQSGDAEAATRVIRRCKSAPALIGADRTIDELMALFARCAAIVSMRLHALIAAARLGIPYVAVPYDPKVGALSRSLAYPQPPLSANDEPNDFIDRFWARRAELANHLRTALPPLQQRAMLSFDWLEELVRT